MKEPSFTEHNQNFAAKCSDPSVFESGGFNFIKIVQQALVYAAKEKSSRVLNNRLHWPLWRLRLFYQIRYQLKRLRQPALPRFHSLLFIENARERFTLSGDAVSMYYERFYKLFGPQEFSVITKRKVPLVPARDILLLDLRRTFATAPLDSKALEMLQALKAVMVKVRQSERFSITEQRFVTSFMHVFFEDFLFWNGIFKESGIRVLVFDNHNYNEGLIAASKVHDIRTVELQHGLITQNDIFYVYPEFVRPVAAKAFFPNRIFVYGEGWKKKLLKGAEHPSENIFVAGDYTFSLVADTPFAPPIKENIIFIGAQKFMGSIYIEYLDTLAPLLLREHPDWCLLIKHHPSEKDKAQYDVLKKYANVKFANDKDDLLTLLRKARIQISYYSTTLYDALGLEVLNFAVQDHSPYADYCAEVVGDGIALPIRMGEDPVSIYLKANGTVMPAREFYYAPFDDSKVKLELEKLIKN